jgi:hypothetical protein
MELWSLIVTGIGAALNLYAAWWRRRRVIGLEIHRDQLHLALAMVAFVAALHALVFLVGGVHAIAGKLAVVAGDTALGLVAVPRCRPDSSPR